MANAKRLTELIEGNGMEPQHLGELTYNYFVDKCVRWFYFNLATDLPILSSNEEIDIKVNFIDYPGRVTIQLGKEATSNDNIKHGRLAPELIQQLSTKPLPTQLGVKIVNGFALTIGKDESGEFLLLELLIKNEQSGEIEIVRPFPPLTGDNLTPTSIPPGKKRK